MKLQKITKNSQALGLRDRWYKDACAAAHTLDLLGERWSLLVVRELMFGPKRFSDLRACLPGISANILTQRLEGLEASGILIQRTLPAPAKVKVYELTEWGYEAEPIFQALGNFGARSPLHDPTLPFSASSLCLSLRTMFDASQAQGFDHDFALILPVERFVGHFSAEGLTISRSEATDFSFALQGEPPAIAAVIYGGQPLDAAEKDGLVTVAGDRALAQCFVTLFPLPQKAGQRA
ncbi:winged helix-turn-helix transcriptional regulator [Oryzifoliimicrobium ureilyticus]|uniref:winged helix-turn-helix transcriptional regulator n=1 Tax=Oryzifoliimicrobium ureilyticus TaxID=3113724 RepID=UPI003F66FFBB